MQQRVKIGFAAAFIIGLFAAVSIGAGTQLTGGPGLTKVVHTGGILSGSGTTAAPLAATITTGTGLTGTGSAGSPLASTVSGGVSSARQILTGTGLTGGGDLSADRTIALANTAVSPSTYTYTTVTVDAQGRITSASNGTSPAVATRQVLTGTGLSGGGDLSADRTISLANTAVGAGTYTYMTATVDAQGRLTSASSGAAPAVATRQIIAGTGLSGGGDLSADRTLSLASINAATLLGNNTGGSTTPSALTASQVRTLLALAAIATSGSGADLSANSVANTALGTMPTLTVKANLTGGTANASDATIASLISALGVKLGEFGDASDGDATMDGSTAVTGYSLAGSTYTATGYAYFGNLTINAGITVAQHSWPGPICRNTCTNNGHVSWDGAAASGQTAGAASVATGPLPLGTAGGNGGAVNGGTGTNGTAGAASVAPRGFSAAAAAGGVGTISPAAVNPGAAGGVGHGGGGGGTLGNGGAGGGQSLLPAASGDWRQKHVAVNGFTPVSGGSNVKLAAGSGGGGGAGGGGVNGGVGGGGGSAGSWGVSKAFAYAGSGTWTANGGAGANGTNATGIASDGGGGGAGGAGGIVVFVSAGTAPTASVTAGTSGNGGTGQTTGRTGGAGGTSGAGLTSSFAP